MEVLGFQPDIAIDVCGDFRAFWNSDVFAMHEQEEWSGRKEQQASGNYPHCHPDSVTAALCVFNSANCGFLSVCQTDVVENYFEFARTTHPPFRLRLCHTADSDRPFRNHDD